MTVPTYPGTSRVIPLRSLQLSRVPSLFRAPLEHSDHVRQLEAALHYTQECLDAREHELEDARTMLSSLVNSRSWKLTAPLRALAALLRQS